MKYLDLFAGYGGFSLGIQKVLPKAECVGFSEIDKYAIDVYLNHFPKHKNYGDITTINSSELPDFDLLTGGFPCQAFSIAGRRGGFSDTRGTLIFEVFRIIKEKRPRFLLLENVRGLLSHDAGATFLTIISTLDELGYDTQWQALNAKDFGVPQNRERVFIVGHLGGFGGRQVFPIGINDEIHTRPNENKKEIHHIASTQTARQYASWNGNYLKEITKNQSQGYRVYDTDGIATNQASQAGGLGAKTGLYMISPTIRANHHNTHDVHFISEDTKIRRLTPTECERLMGLPDGWTEGVSDTQRYKLCGNGVVVNVVEEIIKKLI